VGVLINPWIRALQPTVNNARLLLFFGVSVGVSIGSAIDLDGIHLQIGVFDVDKGQRGRRCGVSRLAASAGRSPSRGCLYKPFWEG